MPNVIPDLTSAQLLVNLLMLLVAGILALPLLALLLLLASSLVLPPLFILAHLRNHLVQALRDLLNLLARPFVVPARAIHRARPQVARCTSQTLQGLQFGSHAGPPSWVGWDLLASLVLCINWSVLSIQDYFLASLAFAALLGVEPQPAFFLPLSVDVASGLLFVAVTTVLGLVLLDVWDASPAKRPWSILPPDTRRYLKIITTVCVALTIVAAVCFLLWRWLQRADPPPEPWSSMLAGLLWVLLGVLIVVASTLAAISLLTAPPSLWALALLALGVVLFVCLVALYVPVLSLRAVQQVTARVVDVPAGWGASIWNWGCKFPIAARLQLQPISFVDPPDVGDDIDLDLFP
jgi:hypothetical protein